MTHFASDLVLLARLVFGWQVALVHSPAVWEENGYELLRTKFFVHLVSIQIVRLLLVMVVHLVGNCALDAFRVVNSKLRW